MAATSLSYYPSEHHASQFWRAQAQPDHREATPQVPEGFPAQLNSPLAWTRSEIERRRSEWFIELGANDVDSLTNALKQFEALSLPLSEISTNTFVLPTDLAQRLKKISDQCYKGAGFTVIHGLDAATYTPEQNAALFAGIAAHVAPQRGFLDRDRRKVLCHVVNAAGPKAEQTSKSPGFTDGPLSFHSDNCEILALYALDVAPEGGKTLVASSWQLYNDLAITRPDVLQTLAENWVLDTFKDYSKHPPVSVPFLHNAEGDKAILRFSRYPITGFSSRKRNSALPAASPAQVEAMDAVQFMAAANAIPLPMGKGDIVFINDMTILHAREKFSEGGDPLRRHLLKLYLRDPEQNWPIPSTAAETWQKIYGPNKEDGSREETWCTRYEYGQEDDWLTNG